MKVLVVRGSARKNSRSNIILDHMLEKFSPTSVKEFKVNQLSLKGCIACRKCKTEKEFCIIHDDIRDYFTSIPQADVVLIGSPNYMGTITGPIKTFLDRHYALTNSEWKPKYDHLKKVVLVMSQGYKNKEFYQNEYERILGVFKTQLNTDGHLIIHGGEIDPLEDPEIMNIINQI